MDAEEKPIEMRSKRNMKLILLNVGVAIALSLAGIIVSRLRSRPRSRNSKKGNSKLDSECKSGNRGLKDELRILKKDETLAKIINGTTTTTTTTTRTTTIVGLSPTSKSPVNGDGFLLPQFNEMMKELDASGRDQESTPTTTTMYKKLEIEKEMGFQQEISHLRSLVIGLSERERSLELQLLEYYGMQEQEVAVRELESRLKMNTMESKLYALKVESLQADNQRLQALVSDYSRVTSELDSARAKDKMLRRKLKSDGEQAREKIAALHQKISMLQAEARERVDEAETGSKLKRLMDLEDEVAILRMVKLKSLKDMEDEVTNLRMINSRLLVDNSELATKLESAQLLASASLERKDDAVEDANQLREMNEKLMNDIDQLKTDRCADVEQLVYLRWVNACLRYELRNYQPPPGKSAARDLSKDLSPRSEAKAKQLILEYANSGTHEKNMGLMDFDSEIGSSQASTGESEDTSFNISPTANHHRSVKSKFLVKLKKLVLGKNMHSKRHSPADRTTTPGSSNSERGTSISSSLDDMIIRDSFSSCVTEEHSANNELLDAQTDEHRQSKVSCRSSLDIQGLQKHKLERQESSVAQDNSGHGGMVNFCKSSLLQHKEMNCPEKAELKKFAEVLKSSNKTVKLNRKAASSFSRC